MWKMSTVCIESSQDDCPQYYTDHVIDGSAESEEAATWFNPLALELIL
jgi:hypothetical protein